MTRIVVLDGHTLQPGDLSWEALEALGPCTIHDRTPAGDAVRRAEGAEVVLTNKAVISREALEKLPDLRYVGVTATGYNVVDVEAASQHGVVVTNVPRYGTESVAQMVFAHLLNWTQHVADHDRSVQAGRWSRSPDFCFWDHPLIELQGLTLGIIGFGEIGRAVARIASAFGMQVVACTVPPTTDNRVTFVDLETLLEYSDVVSLHCPLTPETHGLINAARLAKMKPTAFLINTARGPLVDERALAEALAQGRLAGAGLDVLSSEPPEKSHPLFGVRGCSITPHIAWATRAARKRLLEVAVGNVAAFLAGRPQNVVNRPSFPDSG
jgi:glycerate dehydrogenase